MLQNSFYAISGTFYTLLNNTNLYLSYFILSYVFLGHNDSVEWGLTVNHSSAYTVFCLQGCFSKVSKNSVSRGPPVQDVRHLAFGIAIWDTFDGTPSMYLGRGCVVSKKGNALFFRGLIERMSWHKIFSTKPHQPSTI